MAYNNYWEWRKLRGAKKTSKCLRETKGVLFVKKGYQQAVT